jgi:hypothetical protein
MEAPITSGALFAEAVELAPGVDVELHAASVTASAETPTAAARALRKRLFRAITDPP